jgi:hypothetical protein
VAATSPAAARDVDSMAILSPWAAIPMLVLLVLMVSRRLDDGDRLGRR